MQQLTTLHLTSDTYHLTGWIGMQRGGSSLLARYLPPTIYHLPSDTYRLTGCRIMDAAAYHLAPDIYHLPPTI